MTSEQERAPERPSLSDLLATLDEAEDSEGAFIQLILDGAAQRDPELPQLLRAGAIPRTLNEIIVGLLREKPEDLDRNRHLLEMIAGYRFVLPRPDGGFIYHDNTRDYLLADWRSDEDKRARFVELNQALATYYEEKYSDSQEANRWLGEISALIARANPGRLRRLTATAEANMGANLLEAVYHRLLASPRDGFDFFQTSFFELEQTNRVRVCQSLISFIRDYLQRLPAGDSEPTLLAWLDYFETRMLRALPGYDAARVEEMLRRVLDGKDLPPDLRQWALGDLAQVYEDQLKIGDALRTRLDLLEQPSDVDVYNYPLRYSRLGNLYSWLVDYESAVQQFRLAIEKADQVAGARADIGVLARLDLSAVYCELGDWDAAFEAAIEAVYRARTSHAKDWIMQRSVASRMAQLLSAFDPRASDCAGAEELALAEGVPIQQVDALLNRIDLMLGTDRIRMARAWIDQLAELDDGDDVQSLQVDLAYRRAKLAELEGRKTDADTAYSTLLEALADQPRSEVMRISVLTNRGSVRTKLGDSAGAVADLVAARDAWTRDGCPIDAAAVDVRLAKAHLRAGATEAAQPLLDAANAVIPPVISDYRLALLKVRAEMDEQLGHWDAAEDHYHQALQMAVARGEVERQAALMHALAAVYAKRSQDQLSADYARRAKEADSQLAAADTGTTAEQEQADSENGRGMRSFAAPGDRETALDRARQFFRSAAEFEPGNLWPRLNLTFTYAEQQDWQEASETLGLVLDLSPAPMRTTRLYSCLRDYVVHYVRGLLQRKDAGRAIVVLAAALDRMSGQLPRPAELTPLRSMYSLALALAGEAAAARVACAEALALAEDEHQLADTISPLIDTADVYWSVDTMLRPAQDEPDAPPAWRDKVSAARELIRFRLDEILGLGRGTPAAEIPIVVPIMVEVGDDLVPVVDSRQDGGVFLYELIPAMRERIVTRLGVNVPGVRLRGDPALPANGYRAHVDDVPVLTGSVPPGAYFAEVSESAQAPPGSVTDFQPLTAEPGLWIVLDDTDQRHDGANRLPPAQYLIHQIEQVMRAHLVRYLGPQEVATLVETWSAEGEEDLVTAVLPDADARLRLTWILQRLVEDGLPITDWVAMLTAVRDAGGITTPSRVLYRAVRARLRYQLPGPRTGRKTVFVPAEREQALLELGGAAGGSAASPADPRHEFLRWLRQAVASAGPAITLVTGTQDGREVVSALARTEHRMITTLSRDELAEP
jgi:tetratricopeptide (TPR) repeat protein